LVLDGVSEMLTFVIPGSALLLALLIAILLDYPRAKPHERDREPFYPTPIMIIGSLTRD
jgi:fructose-specific phosphotransferase system IIC component